MNGPRNLRCAMPRLVVPLFLLILLLEEAVGNRHLLDETSSHTRLWQGSDVPSNQKDGRLVFDLEEDYFDNSDPYVMGGSEDVPVQRPFIPFDPLTNLPGVIRRPASFERNFPTKAPNSNAGLQAPPRHTSSPSHRRPHANSEDETSWRWPSDTVRPEFKLTTRPATEPPHKSVTHAQVFLRPKDVPSIRVPSDILPASHHVVSSHQDGEVNYLNRQLGESLEEPAINVHQHQQSHESTQVHVVESVGMEHSRPASDEEVYGLSGELSTLDHVAKTTPMQNDLAKEGGDGGDSVEQPTIRTISEKNPISESNSNSTLQTTNNVHTSVLSSVGMIIQQSAGHTSTTTSKQVTNGNNFMSNFSSTTEEKVMHTVRPPIYRTSGLTEVTHYIPSSASSNSGSPTNFHDDDHHAKTTQPTNSINSNGAKTPTMSVVTRKSITVSTSDDTATSQQMKDGSEETGTTTGILGVRVKFTMSGEDERFSAADDSAESEVTDQTDSNVPNGDTVPSALLPLITPASSTEQSTTDTEIFTTNTMRNVVAQSNFTNMESKPVMSTSSTHVITDSNPTVTSVTSKNSPSPTTTYVTEHDNPTPTTVANFSPTTSTVANSSPMPSTVVHVSATATTTNRQKMTNSATTVPATRTVTSSRSTTTRQGKAIAISVGRNTKLHNSVPNELPNGNNSSQHQHLNRTHFVFNFPTRHTTTLTTIPTSVPTVVPNDSQTVSQSSSENTVVTVTAQDTVPSAGTKNYATTEQFFPPTSWTTTSTPMPTTTKANVTVDKPTERLDLEESVSNNKNTDFSESTSPDVKIVNTTTIATTTISTRRPTTKPMKISTYANRPFVLPTAPSVLDDPRIRDKISLATDSSELMDSGSPENLSLPTAPSVFTEPTVERATIRHRLRRPQITRTTTSTSLWRPTLRSRKNSATLPAVTPYPTRSTTSPHPDLHETMAPPVIQHNDNQENNRELEPPDIHKFFENNNDQADDTVLISPATTNTIIISSVIGGCAILFFFCLMIFCMCKQKKLRRARYRQPPDYANVFVGKYS